MPWYWTDIKALGGNDTRSITVYPATFPALCLGAGYATYARIPIFTYSPLTTTTN